MLGDVSITSLRCDPMSLAGSRATQSLQQGVSHGCLIECWAAERILGKPPLATRPNPGKKARVAERKSIEPGFALSTRNIYTNQQRGIAAATKCSLAGSVEEQGRYCISFKRKDFSRKAYVANDAYSKTVRLRFGVVEARCSGVVVVVVQLQEPWSNDRLRSKWKIDSDKPILEAKLFRWRQTRIWGTAGQAKDGRVGAVSRWWEDAQLQWEDCGLEQRDSKRI